MMNIYLKDENDYTLYTAGLIYSKVSKPVMP